jgi:hypothetical protein
MFNYELTLQYLCHLSPRERGRSAATGEGAVNTYTDRHYELRISIALLINKALFRNHGLLTRLSGHCH